MLVLKSDSKIYPLIFNCKLYLKKMKLPKEALRRKIFITKYSKNNLIIFSGKVKNLNYLLLSKYIYKGLATKFGNFL